MIDKNKIVIRNSVETDDVKQIAKLIYSSDLNIYGAMFNDEICAWKVLQELISTNTINISIKNLIVAEYENSIVGMLCFIEDDYFDDRYAYKSAFSKLKIELPEYFDEVFNVYWNKIIKENFKNSYYISNYFDDRYAYKSAFSKLKIELPEYFDEVFNVYWNKIIKENFKNSYYISNVAVDKNYQNLGIGKRLLNYFKETHSDKPVGLDVVKDNEAAINAYIKSGFKIINKDSINKDISVPLRMVCDNK